MNTSVPGKTFQLQGHRGARGLFPENTIEGFRAAIAMGLRWFELDVGVLRDGTVVVHHDLALNPDIARTPGNNWFTGAGPLLRRMDWEEAQDYDVGRILPGSMTAQKFPDQVPQDGARIPRLADVLALDHRIGWNIELKLQPDRPDWTVPVEEMVERTLAAVDAAGAAGRVTIQSFDWRAPRYSRRIRPEIPCGWLTRAETIADPALWWGLEAPPSPPEAIAAEGGGTWTPYWEELTPELLSRAHALGLQVIPWTVNDTEAMRRLVAWGVDGVITDYPDRMPA
ncbi:MAG: glycerophosphodiester phosphodiesterase family protein [Janthinobacterium lividum]